MGKLGNALKKIGGVVLGVGAAVSKVVAPALSGVLSNVSQKLLASPTPLKDSAALLQSGAPQGQSTPIKEASVALQLKAPPVQSVVKQSSLDLIGISNGVSALVSAAKQNAPAKIVDDLVNGPKKIKSNFTILYVIVGVVVVVLGFVLLSPKRRR